MIKTLRNVSLGTIGLVALAFFASGCALLAAPGVEGATSLAGTAGTTATGYLSTQSIRELNTANVEFIRAQANLQKAQASELRNKREDLESERAATAGILREMALQRNDPTLSELAIWVEAGGDPDYAMHYALEGATKTAASKSTNEKL
jgi:hypothetical protein